LTSVPMPSMPALPTPADSMPKAPEPLPRSMSAKSPTGPVFPTATQGPSLGAFPAAPSPSAMPSPILPPITHVTGDDIPSAPSFLPSPR
jgi:hypothetical protein